MGRGRARNHFPTLPYFRKIGTGLAIFTASGYWVIGPCPGQLMLGLPPFSLSTCSFIPILVVSGAAGKPLGSLFTGPFYQKVITEFPWERVSVIVVRITCPGRILLSPSHVCISIGITLGIGFLEHPSPSGLRLSSNLSPDRHTRRTAHWR